MPSSNGNGTASLWKWVSALLATAMLAGAPGYIQLLSGQPHQAEVDRIRDRQDIVLQRLATIDQQVVDNAADVAELHDEIRELQAILTGRTTLPERGR